MKAIIAIIILLISFNAWGQMPCKKPCTIDGATGGTITGDMAVTGDITADTYSGPINTGATVTVCSTTASSNWHCNYTCASTLSCSTALQAAIDEVEALSKPGGLIRSTEGSFYIDAALTVTEDIVFRGNGWSGTATVWINAPGLNADMITVDGSSGAITAVQFQDMQFNGNNGNNTSGDGIVTVGDVNDLIVKNVFIHSFAGNAMTLSKGWGFVCDICIIEYNDGKGIYMPDAGYSNNSFKVVNSKIILNDESAIYMELAHNAIITNNLFDSLAVATGVDNGGSASTTILTDTTKDFTSAEYGVQTGTVITNVTDSQTCTVTTVNATTLVCAVALTGSATWDAGDSYSIDARIPAVDVVNSDKTVFTGNTFIDSQYIDLRYDASAEVGIVTGNTFASSNADYAIWWENNTTHLQIHSNWFSQSYDIGQLKVGIGSQKGWFLGDGQNLLQTLTDNTIDPWQDGITAYDSSGGSISNSFLRVGQVYETEKLLYVATGGNNIDMRIDQSCDGITDYDFDTTGDWLKLKWVKAATDCWKYMDSFGVVINGGIHQIETAYTGTALALDGELTKMVTLTAAGAETLTTITGGIAGQTITLLFTDANITVTDTDAHTSNTIDLRGTATNITSADDLAVTLIYNGTSWYQTAYESVN